jgi:ABC-2 type transport system permease protein
MTDFTAILWKESKEILLQGASAGRRHPLILVAVLGIFIPYRMGLRFFAAQQLLVFILLSIAMIATVIADSFAGERERHTLETLLASRVSDRAILFGKLAASVGYGWLMSMACVLVGTVTVNFAYGKGTLLFYDTPASLAILALGPPLVGSFAATLGVLVSLRAATVRQAQQTLMVGFLVLVLGTIFGIGALPADWKVWFAMVLSNWGPTTLVLLAFALLLTIDGALLMAAIGRFKRSRLVLD